MAMTPALTTFTLHRMPGSEIKRQVAIDPKKVSSVRETVHGSVIITYSARQSFEVEGPHKTVVKAINSARCA